MPRKVATPQWTQSADSPEQGTWHYTWLPEEEVQLVMVVKSGSEECRVQMNTPDPARYDRTASYPDVASAKAGAKAFYENYVNVHEHADTRKASILEMLNAEDSE